MNGVMVYFVVGYKAHIVSLPNSQVENNTLSSEPSPDTFIESGVINVVVSYQEFIGIVVGAFKGIMSSSFLWPGLNHIFKEVEGVPENRPNSKA